MTNEVTHQPWFNNA